MNSGCRVQDQLNTSESTAPYVKDREINVCITYNQYVYITCNQYVYITSNQHAYITCNQYVYITGNQYKYSIVRSGDSWVTGE